jgi:hypothetical protein
MNFEYGRFLQTQRKYIVDKKFQNQDGKEMAG